MTLIDKGRRLFTTKPEPPIKNGGSRDDHFFDDIRRHGPRPPVLTPEQQAGMRRKVVQAQIDDEPEPAEFDFTAEEVQLFRAQVADLQRELTPVPVAPLPIEGEIINEFEQIAVSVERELVEFRMDAVETIRRGLDFAAEMRQRGRDHGTEVRGVLTQAAALREKYSSFSATQGGDDNAKSQTPDSHALGQAGGSSDHRAPADAKQPAGQAEQGSSVRELHRDAERGPQGLRLAQRTPEVPPQA